MKDTLCIGGGHSHHQFGVNKIATFACPLVQAVWSKQPSLIILNTLPDKFCRNSIVILMCNCCLRILHFFCLFRIFKVGIYHNMASAHVPVSLARHVLPTCMLGKWFSVISVVVIL